MVSKETRELARDKVYSIYTVKMFKVDDKDPYWSVSQESAEFCKESDQRDLDAWSYILGLIEKDNKL
jgi:hypothetical protein